MSTKIPGSLICYALAPDRQSAQQCAHGRLSCTLCKWVDGHDRLYWHQPSREPAPQEAQAAPEGVVLIENFQPPTPVIASPEKATTDVVSRQAAVRRIAELEGHLAAQDEAQITNRARIAELEAQLAEANARWTETTGKVVELEAKLAAQGEALTEVELKGIYDIWIEHQKHPSERGTIEAMRMAAEAQRKKGPK